MPRAVAYKTFNGLLIALEQEDDEHVVTITGTSVKELLKTPVRKAARKYYDDLVKHYEERKAAEA